MLLNTQMSALAVVRIGSKVAMLTLVPMRSTPSALASPPANTSAAASSAKRATRLADVIDRISASPWSFPMFLLRSSLPAAPRAGKQAQVTGPAVRQPDTGGRRPRPDRTGGARVPAGLRQTSMACGQRGWKAQPAGTATGLGGSLAAAAAGGSASGSMRGIALSRAWV